MVRAVVVVARLRRLDMVSDAMPMVAWQKRLMRKRLEEEYGTYEEYFLHSDKNRARCHSPQRRYKYTRFI